MTLTVEAKYPINFTQTNKRFVLSLHYNGINSFIFVNATKIYQFKGKNSKIKGYTLCLGNISKDFTINNLKKNGIRKGYGECKKLHACEKDYAWNSATCNWKNGKSLASIMDNMTITCHEIIESYDEGIKTIPTNFNEKKATCKTQNFCISLAFLLITIALLIATVI